MTRQHSFFSIVCILSIFIFNFCFSVPTLAQDKNKEKTDQIAQPTQSDNQEDFVDTALELDGKSSYVEIVNSDALNTINKQVTVTAWIKAKEFPNRYTPILYKGDKRTPGITNRSYVMHLRNDRAVQFASSPNGKGEKYIFSPIRSNNPQQMASRRWCSYNKKYNQGLC